MIKKMILFFSSCHWWTKLSRFNRQRNPSRYTNMKQTSPVKFSTHDIGTSHDPLNLSTTRMDHSNTEERCVA